jgi:hypothetical protein
LVGGGLQSTGRPPRRSAKESTAPWLRPSTPTSIPIAAPGTARRRHPGSTRTSPPSSSARPAGRGRGGLAAAAAFHERAAERTPEPAHRAQRALAAAQSKRQAGALDAALQLLAMAKAGPLDELERARADLLCAQTVADSGHGRDALPLLLKAAKRLEPIHFGLARETYRDAFYAALTAGRLAIRGGMLEVAEAVLAADCEGSSFRRSPPACDLLDGLAVVTTEGCAAGTPMLRRALSAFRNQGHCCAQQWSLPL